MKSANRHSLIVILALLAIVGVSCIATSGAKASGAVDQAQLHATAGVEKWASVPLDGHVFVNVFVNGEALAQHGYRECGANYTGRGLFVWVTLTSCTAAGAHPAVIRYLSVRGEQSFTVKITRHPILASPF